MPLKLLEWSDSYLIGIEELDFEHKDLFDRLNELHRDLASNDDNAWIEGCLGEICSRVGAHFALEERYMQRTKFANYEAHKKEHDTFLEVIIEVVETFRANPDPSFRDTLVDQLQRWVLDHITTSDREIGH